MCHKGEDPSQKKAIDLYKQAMYLPEYRYHQRIPLLAAAVQADSHLKIARIHHAIACARVGDNGPVSALLSDDSFLHDGTMDAGCRVVRGVSLMYAGELDEAHILLKRADQSNPADDMFYSAYYLGRLEEMRGNTEAALEYYNRALLRTKALPRPDAPPVFFHALHCEALIQIEQHAFLDALLFLMAITQNRPHPDYFVDIIRLHTLMGSAEHALRTAEQALRQFPQSSRLRDVHSEVIAMRGW